jgi:hypothetical protein
LRGWRGGRTTHLTGGRDRPRRRLRRRQIQRPGELGGLVLVACGAWSARRWNRVGGPGLAVGLGLTYAGAFGASHPLAKRIGAWPSVFAVTAVAAGAAALADRRA